MAAAERCGGDAKRARVAPCGDAGGAIPAGLQAWLTTQLDSAREKATARHAKDAGAATPPLLGPSAADTTAALVEHVLRELPERADVDDAVDAGAAGDAEAALRSARCGRFRDTARRLAGALFGDWALADAYFVAGSAPLSAAVAAALRRREQSDASRAVIVSHHRRLRASVCAVQPAAEAERQSAWAAAVADEAALEAYAGAAAETGRRSWARASLRWCLEVARDYLRSGAGRSAAKAARRAHFAAHAAPMTQADVDAAAAQAQAQAREAVGVGRRPRLVDIGSCFDGWRPHEDQFEVTAFDLRPVAAQVYRADALALRLGPPGSAVQSEPPADAADGAGRLLALPAASFHVAVLSLVLSYVPDPMHRTQMVALARQLLCDDAGLLLIVTPLSTDRSHRPERALPVMREWRCAIEALGFVRFAAARLPTVHGLAFRCAPRPAPPRALQPMRIAYDALSAAQAAEARRAEDACDAP